MFSKELINKTISDIETASKENNNDLFSKTRDVFQARLDTYVSRTNKYLESGNSIVLADFGEGVRKTISRVKVVADDLEALNVNSMHSAPLAREFCTIKTEKLHHLF